MSLKLNNKLITIILTIISIITIITCLICNYLLSYTLNWSLIVLSTIIFSYLLILPSLILSKKKRLLGSLISLTILILPYLFILTILLHNFNTFKIGSISSIITILYLWGTYLISHKVKNLKGAALEILLTAIFSLVINIVLSLILSTNTFTIFNIICIIFLFIFSIICFIYSHKYHL